MQKYTNCSVEVSNEPTIKLIATLDFKLVGQKKAMHVSCHSEFKAKFTTQVCGFFFSPENQLEIQYTGQV